MDFLRKILKSGKLNLPFEIKTSYSDPSDRSIYEIALPAAKILELSKKYHIIEYESVKVVNTSAKAFELINLMRFAQTPENILRHATLIPSHIEILCVFKSINPAQFKVDVQFGFDQLSDLAPKNRVAKKQYSFVEDCDKFALTLDFNMQIFIWETFEMIFENLDDIEDQHLQRTIAKEWLLALKSQYQIIKNMYSDEDIQAGVLYTQNKILEHIKHLSKTR